jgi:hypothetical protein
MKCKMTTISTRQFIVVRKVKKTQSEPAALGPASLGSASLATGPAALGSAAPATGPASLGYAPQFPPDLISKFRELYSIHSTFLTQDNLPYLIDAIKMPSPMTIKIKKTKPQLTEQQLAKMSKLEQFNYHYDRKITSLRLKTPSPESIAKSEKVRIIQFEDTEVDVIIVTNHDSKEYLYEPTRGLFIGERRKKRNNDDMYVFNHQLNAYEVIYDYDVWEILDGMLPISCGIYSPWALDENGRPFPTNEVMSL